MTMLNGTNMTTNALNLANLRLVVTENLNDPDPGLKLKTESEPGAFSIKMQSSAVLEIASEAGKVFLSKDQAKQIFGLIEPKESHINALRALRLACIRINDMLMGDDGQAWKEAAKTLPALLESVPEPDAYMVRWNHRQIQFRNERISVPILDADKRWELVNKIQGQQILSAKLLHVNLDHPQATVDVANLYFG